MGEYKFPTLNYKNPIVFQRRIEVSMTKIIKNSPIEIQLKYVHQINYLKNNISLYFGRGQASLSTKSSSLSTEYRMVLKYFPLISSQYSTAF